MIAYILKVTLCWLLFYGVYELFLKNKTFFNANRSYLLITLVAGIALPLLEFIPWKNESNVAYVIYPMLMEIDDLQAVVATKKEDTFNWYNLLYILYAVGFVMSSIRFSLGINKILKLYKSSAKKKQNGYTLVITDETHLPFSFFKWVFFSKKMSLTNEVDRILEHEIEHIKGRHSFDVLATEILKVVFWCSPMIYLYRNALKEIHEFLADNAVLRNTDKISYKRLLLDQTNNGLQMALTHQFFNSHLKNRLKMISQERSGRPTLVMYALGIPVLLLLLFAFTYSFQEKGSESENVPELIENIGNYYMEDDPEKAPYFQINGEDIELPLYDHLSLYGNIGNPVVLLPDDAVRQFGERAKLGYVNFEKPSLKSDGGYLKGYNLRKNRDVYMNLMRSAMEVNPPEKLAAKSKVEKTIPSAGKNMMAALMAGISSNATQRNIAPRSFSQDLEVEFDNIARFPACEGEVLEGDELDLCAMKEMLKFVYSNLEYPEKARANGVYGTANIDFVVTKEGNLEDFNIYRNLGGDCGYAALEAVKKLKDLGQKWIPAEKDGEAVNMRYVLPVRFNLDEKGREAYKNLDLKLDTVPTVVGTKTDIKEEIFKVVEEMPRFPGCEEMEGGTKEKEECAKQKMLEHIYSNLKYPKAEREKGIQGMAVVQFVIDKSGEVRDVNVVRSITGSLDAEVVKVTKSMNHLAEKWRPGIQRGKAVNVLYTLPVRFKLQGDERLGEEGSALENEDAKEFGEDLITLTALDLRKHDKLEVEKNVEDVASNAPTAVDILRIDLAKNTARILEKYGARNQGNSDNEIVDNPLIVIDNDVFDGSLSDIEREEIAWINVFKGEQAIAKYGEKAKGGVLLVRTKAAQGNLVKATSVPKVVIEGKKASSTEVKKIVLKSVDEKNQPLFIVDGKEYLEGDPSQNLDSEDIAAVHILKGEKAIIEYGSKGAKGVVIITTKKSKLETSKNLEFETDNANRLELETVSVYPNPARETINVNFKAAAVATIIQLIDIDGKLIKDLSDNNFNGTFDQTIDLTSFSSELILLRIEQEGKIFTKKIIIE